MFAKCRTLGSWITASERYVKTRCSSQVAEFMENEASGVSPASGRRSVPSDRKKNCKSRITNVEQEMSNVEGMNSVY